jgi:hypothetical protein
MTISTFKNKVFIYLYISIDDISTKLPTYAYQQNIIWNSFNECMEIDVQNKYENLLTMTYIVGHLHKESCLITHQI